MLDARDKVAGRDGKMRVESTTTKTGRFENEYVPLWGGEFRCLPPLRASGVGPTSTGTSIVQLGL
jgi:hypothetical protein